MSRQQNIYNTLTPVSQGGLQIHQKTSQSRDVSSPSNHNYGGTDNQQSPNSPLRIANYGKGDESYDYSPAPQ